MKINISLPFDQTEKPDEFLTPDAIVEVAQHAERLGYDGGNVTDHPCPTGRWLDSGGHHAHDPFVLLSFVAAATTTFRLQTGILVLPYRTVRVDSDQTQHAVGRCVQSDDEWAQHRVEDPQRTRDPHHGLLGVDDRIDLRDLPTNGAE